MYTYTGAAAHGCLILQATEGQISLYTYHPLIAFCMFFVYFTKNESLGFLSTFLIEMVTCVLSWRHSITNVVMVIQFAEVIS